MVKSKAKELSPETTLVLHEIGRRIRSKRKTIEPNYIEFAEKYGMNYYTLSRIENGKNYTLSTLIEVLRVLDIPIEDLFQDIR